MVGDCFFRSYYGSRCKLDWMDFLSISFWERVILVSTEVDLVVVGVCSVVVTLFLAK